IAFGVDRFIYYSVGLNQIENRPVATLLLPTNLLAAGLVFAFQHSTVPGKIVLFTLFIGSIFSWSVMWTKLRMIQLAKKQGRVFLENFRADRQPLRLYESEIRFHGAPVFRVYWEGCRELTLHL